MLTCATNPFQCLVSGPAVRWAADRYFSASESLRVLMDCGGAADRRDLAGARSGSSATATGQPSAFAARHAVAGIRTGLRVRNSLVRWNLLLGLRHHAPLWRAADSGRRAGADLVLHVYRALPRNVRAAAGLGRRDEDRRIEDHWTESRRTKARRIGSGGSARARGGSVSLGRGGTRPDADHRVSMGASGLLADREFCAHADCDTHRRLRALV